MTPVSLNMVPEAEFKKFEPKPRLKYGWFHLKSYLLLQDLSRRITETECWFKFGSNSLNSEINKEKD